MDIENFVETFEFVENGVYRNRKLVLRNDEENNIHFFEVNKENEEDFEKEIDIETIQWLVKNKKLPISLKKHLPGYDLEQLDFFTYKGKSKKITTKKVVLLSKTGNRCKIQDMEGNETIVSDKQLLKL